MFSGFARVEREPGTTSTKLEFLCETPLVAALVFIFLRVDLAGRLFRTQYLSRRAPGQRPDIVETSTLRIPR